MTIAPPVTYPDSLIAAVAAAPDDKLPKLLLADWCDEHGQPGWANGMRWAAKHGKRPMIGRPAAKCVWFPGGGWYPDKAMFSYTPKSCRIPAATGKGDVVTASCKSDHDILKCWRLFLDWAANLAWDERGEPKG